MSIYSQTFLYLYRLLLFLPQKTGMRENISIIGRGIGQVMFQNNALSGIIMLIGIICIGFGFSLGLQVVVARRNGEGNLAQTGEIFWQGLLFLVSLSILTFTLSKVASPL